MLMTQAKMSEGGGFIKKCSNTLLYQTNFNLNIWTVKVRHEYNKWRLNLGMQPFTLQLSTKYFICVSIQMYKWDTLCNILYALWSEQTSQIYQDKTVMLIPFHI